MKTCPVCKETKEFSEFHKRTYPSGKVGTQGKCKVCQNNHLKKWAKQKRKTDPEYRKKYRETQNKRRENPEYVALHNSLCAKRRARKLKATPEWLSKKQKDRMTNIYRVRAKISAATGKEHHVDHVVPLKGENVCGLHVPWNLAIIPAEMNLSKGNKENEL